MGLAGPTRPLVPCPLPCHRSLISRVEDINKHNELRLQHRPRKAGNEDSRPDPRFIFKALRTYLQNNSMTLVLM